MRRFMICFLICVLAIGITACENVSHEKDTAAMFRNSVFIGDSITEGFAFNEIIPKECVIAGAGATAGFTYDDIDALPDKNPDNIFIMLGSIDILMPVDDPKELFKDDLTKLVKRIKEELPNSKIYLQSITPVTEDAFIEEPRYKEIEEYNELLKELGEKLAVNYVDIGVLAQDNPDLYAEDGIHFKKEFYNLWLEELFKSM
ncbi:GDSL-type esterase/lipase family protein [Tissierella sp. Yu-01]|uniref:GDSL-type esterase/lipase family protein n=1 Tax=Tissierella sp. Yu-01 TaxID=3035694 RepID=UPI00240DAFF9|nr:GDSL-type esterase/lipase family protein [Tissierella sp. Yu-01]WFA09293.1 GDSL-type esterase/lipase family protein [Tissierella sp. Yu-01]